ncbi:Hypothetical protein D9617_24g016880 [Elsinoe fawcettii]|nr:Hypothetical protein D9617_24g016880 [Elsinoe fawcettii]
MEQAEFAEKIYDPRAIGYNNSHHVNLAAWYVDYADLKSGETLLDLASGTGLVAFAAADKIGHDSRIIGVDISKGMLTEAWAQSSGDTYPNVTFYNHDITNLDSLDAVQGKQFDVITLCSAFVLLENPVEAAKSWLKYLKPGGRLIVDAVTPQSLPAGLAAELTAKQLNVPVGHNTAWSNSEDALRDVLQKAGYRVVDLVLKDLEDASGRTISIDDVDSVFEQQIKLPAMQFLAHGSTIDQARKVYADIFTKMAKDGKVVERPSIWVATAIKP